MQCAVRGARLEQHGQAALICASTQIEEQLLQRGWQKELLLPFAPGRAWEETHGTSRRGTERSIACAVAGRKRDA